MTEGGMMIRNATFTDLPNIAKVHLTCFPNSFSSHLGKRGRLLEKYYQEYMASNPKLFLVAVDDKEALYGFCMGYYCEQRNMQRQFLKKNLLRVTLRFIVLLISADAVAWAKVFSLFKRNSTRIFLPEFEGIPLDKRGDLLSICILPSYRGDGTSRTILERYHDALRQSGKLVCQLSVHGNNLPAIKFYEKNGYLKYKETRSQLRTYMKYL